MIFIKALWIDVILLLHFFVAVRSVKNWKEHEVPSTFNKVTLCSPAEYKSKLNFSDVADGKTPLYQDFDLKEEEAIQENKAAKAAAAKAMLEFVQGDKEPEGVKNRFKTFMSFFGKAGMQERGLNHHINQTTKCIRGTGQYAQSVEVIPGFILDVRALVIKARDYYNESKGISGACPPFTLYFSRLAAASNGISQLKGKKSERAYYEEIDWDAGFVYINEDEEEDEARNYLPPGEYLTLSPTEIACKMTVRDGVHRGKSSTVEYSSAWDSAGPTRQGEVRTFSTRLSFEGKRPKIMLNGEWYDVIARRQGKFYYTKNWTHIGLTGKSKLETMIMIMNMWDDILQQREATMTATTDPKRKADMAALNLQYKMDFFIHKIIPKQLPSLSTFAGISIKRTDQVMHSIEVTVAACQDAIMEMVIPEIDREIEKASATLTADGLERIMNILKGAVPNFFPTPVDLQGLSTAVNKKPDERLPADTKYIEKLSQLTTSIVDFKGLWGAFRVVPVSLLIDNNLIQWIIHTCFPLKASEWGDPPAKSGDFDEGTLKMDENAVEQILDHQSAELQKRASGDIPHEKQKVKTWLASKITGKQISATEGHEEDKEQELANIAFEAKSRRIIQDLSARNMTIAADDEAGLEKLNHDIMIFENRSKSQLSKTAEKKLVLDQQITTMKNTPPVGIKKKDQEAKIKALETTMAAVHAYEVMVKGFIKDLRGLLRV